MKKIFWDTNVLLDLLDNKRPAHTQAKELKEFLKQTSSQCLCAWHSLSVLEYVGMKEFGKEDTWDIIREIVEEFIIPKTGTEEAKRAFTYLSGDYEDAMQTASAVIGGADYFVTGDQKGFAKSPLKVVSPLECIKWLKK